jgi:alpha-L-fucosidase 2
MMQEVWDYFDHSQNSTWLRIQGYPLLKGVAQFWLSQLQEDLFFHDGTLVVNPCNSPEQGPTTFGCAHYQQLLHQVFEAILASAALVSESDDEFLTDISQSLARLDTGVHFTDWGGIKEWKLPDSYGYDVPNTHRHLSHLVGWHPGYAISSFDGGYFSNTSIQNAVRETLIARGIGYIDSNTGWEKVWRAACWARLNDSDTAYFELRYTIQENIVGNGLDMYSGNNAPFQIDANFGFAGAVLSMLIVDLPLSYSDASRGVTRTVVLGPAIPKQWGGGSVRGLRLRGGGSVDFAWDDNGLANMVTLTGRSTPLRVINVAGTELAHV